MSGDLPMTLEERVASLENIINKTIDLTRSMTQAISKISDMIDNLEKRDTEILGMIQDTAEEIAKLHRSLDSTGVGKYVN